MKPKYKIVWAKVAESDLNNILEYISIDSPQNALKILKKIKQKASELYTLPESKVVRSAVDSCRKLPRVNGRLDH